MSTSLIQKDNQLLRQARDLALFYNHATVYIIAVVFMWLVWIITGGRYRMSEWPFYIAMGWGIVLFVHYIVVYRRFHKGKAHLKATKK